MFYFGLNWLLWRQNMLRGVSDFLKQSRLADCFPGALEMDSLYKFHLRSGVNLVPIDTQCKELLLRVHPFINLKLFKCFHYLHLGDTIKCLFIVNPFCVKFLRFLITSLPDHAGWSIQLWIPHWQSFWFVKNRLLFSINECCLWQYLI